MPVNQTVYSTASYSSSNSQQLWSSIDKSELISLDDHEQQASGGSGGHTIARHVGKSISELVSRFPGVPVSSTFFDKELAEVAASEWFKKHYANFNSWLIDPARDDIRYAKELTLSHILGTFIYGDDSNQIVYISKKFTLVIKVKPHNGENFHVLTSFPIPE